MRPHRWLLAPFAGALVMFAWSAFSHTSLIRGVGFTRLPDEDTVVAALRATIKDDGLYFFPGIDWDRRPTPAESAALETRFRAGNGIILYHPSSGPPVSPRKLVVQFTGDLLAAMIAAALVSFLAAPYWGRVLAVGALGAFGCLGVSALYWNWYGFTNAFFVAHCADKIIGWLLAGLAIARLAPAPAAITARQDAART